jgi:hypothetical protein
MGCEYINPRAEEQEKYYQRVRKLREGLKNVKLSEFEAQELPALQKLFSDPMKQLFEGELKLLEARFKFIAWASKGNG